MGGSGRRVREGRRSLSSKFIPRNQCRRSQGLEYQVPEKGFQSLGFLKEIAKVQTP